MESLVNQFEKINLNLIKSTRKKKDGTESFLLIDDLNYEYKLSYKSKNEKITWRCNNTDYPNCPGSVFTLGYNKPITILRNHDHNPKIKTKVKEITAQMRKLAETQPDTKPRKIILESQKCLTEEVAAHLPTYNAARLICARARTDPYDIYDIPTDLNFILHENFLKTINGDLFVVYDEIISEKNRMIIFSTEKNFQILSEHRHWLCDGTFDAVPSIFKQLET